MRTERERVLDAVVEAQSRVKRAMHTVTAPTWLQLHLTMAQLKALFVLSESARSVGEVGEALGVGKAAASILVDRLVQLGLAGRLEDAGDRRRTLVHLTAAGQDSVNELREGGHGCFREWLGRLPDDDLAALRRGMEALATAAEGGEAAGEAARGVDPSVAGPAADETVSSRR